MKLFSIILSIFIVSSALAIECTEGMYPVSGHPRAAYFRTDGTYVPKTNVSNYCKKYRSEGPLQITFQRKIPRGWPFKKEVFIKCSNEKQKNINQVINTLPKILTQVGEIKILCAKKSATASNPATCALEEKIIVLYDFSFEMDLKRILTHELAHFLYHSLSTKELKQYWKVAQWSDFNQAQNFTTKRTSFSAPDGATDPEEDFANNVEYFYAEPEVMSKNFSLITKWLSKFLGDKQ